MHNAIKRATLCYAYTAYREKFPKKKFVFLIKNPIGLETIKHTETKEAGT